MASPRFKVAIVNGSQTMATSFLRHGPGLSAHILDTLDCHHVVETFRSEDSIGVTSDGVRLHQARRRGRDGARRDAEHACARLNAEDA